MSNWIITRDYIDNGKAVGRCRKVKNSETQPMKFKFRIKDGDDEVYFSGFCSQESFDPLDDFGYYYGCTSIEYFNKKTRRWEML